MVAIFVVLTIVAFLLLDYIVQRYQARRSESHSSSVKSGNPAAPPLSTGPISVPPSLFFHYGHTWIKFSSPTKARVGLDDLAQRILGRIEGLRFPKIGERIQQGAPLFMVRVGSHRIFLPAPSDGVVTQVNMDLLIHPESLHASPFDAGWVCEIRPENISRNIRELLSSEEAVRWEVRELNKLQQFLSEKVEVPSPPPAAESWLGHSWTDERHHVLLEELSKSFFILEPERSQILTEVF